MSCARNRTPDRPLCFSYYTVLTYGLSLGPLSLLCHQPPSHTDYDSSLLPIVTHTSTTTSCIWTMMHSDSLLVLLLVVLVAFQVLVLVVSALHSVLFNLYS
jgi:hypothetical protein